MGLLVLGNSALGQSGTGLLGQYFNNMDFTGFVLERVDATINFDWASGSPNGALDANTFSVRWSGSVQPRYSQTYTFSTTTDDGVRLWVNGQSIIDRWIDQGPTTHSGTIALTANQLYEIRMDYYENTGGAVARLQWSSSSQAQEIIPQSRLFPPPTGGNRRPFTPLVTEPATDGQLVNPADVHMETSPFADPDQGEAHVCSDFEIWTISPAERVWVTACIGGVERTHTHLGDGVFENSHAGRRELFYERDYRLRVRHKDDSGDPATEWSNWGERRFRTTSIIDPFPGAPGWRVLQAGYKVEVVATGFQLPVNIAFVPNPGSAPHSPYYYVTELYGIIKVVTRNGTVHDYATGLLNFNPTGAFPGSGEQGLTGIVVDPATGNVYATMLYDAGGPHYPKVVRFTSADGGLTSATQTIIRDMPGETQGQSHQISNITIGPDGKLYVHMGDGFDASTAQNLASYRGKILRMNLDGSAPADNPFYNAGDGITARDYVFAYGLRNPFGGDWRAADGMHYEVENGPSVDRFAQIVRGRNYLWSGGDASMRNFAIYNWEPSTGPVNIQFIQASRFNGSGFPSEKFDHAFVSESGPTFATGPQSNGKRISEFVLNASGGLVSGPTPLIEYNGTGKATVVALAAGPDGLYFSDFYKDLNAASPIERGANILRVRWAGTNGPPAVALTSPPDGAVFREGTNILLAATAAASGTNISVVEFFAGATKLGQDASSPYEFTWSNVSTGAYQLTARATDARGLSATSLVVSITVVSSNTPVIIVATNTLVARGAVWRYLDDGSNQGTDWIGASFADSSWPSGAAQLGYSGNPAENDETTIINGGPVGNRFITYYFRRAFQITNASSYTNVTVSVLRDDGAVVYLNGAEVFRSNMPQGPVNYLTLASSAVTGAAETTQFFSTNVAPSRLLEGANLLAVEIHQNTNTSSDVSFDLDLIGTSVRAIVPPVRLHGENASANQFRLWFNAPSGVPYVIEASLNLATWTPVHTNSASASGRFEWLDNRSLSRRFYRARQQ